MSSRCLKGVAFTALALLAAACGAKGGGAPAPPARELRVCADPNNLPYSNRKGEGFENRLAEMVARDLHARVSYVWWPQHRGFIRNTLKAGKCDVLLGLPSSVELAFTTRPYYRSTYVFVSRRDRGIGVRSFDDPVLRKLRIGVQMIGDDGTNSPPAHALAKRRIIDNIKGYSVYGDYSQPNPPARIVEAVAQGDVDMAVVWGPLAGYFAPRQKVALELVPVSPQIDRPFLPFVFDVSMAVRRGDDKLHAELDSFIERRQPEIDALLDRYGVPRVGAT
ncbi:MAG: substrate-binding domain-containing protein [Thermoanaerobaculia bacterium]